jgi:SET domain-containing protein
MIHQGLQIGEIPDKGRAVYCIVDLTANTVIEVAPVIVMSKKDRLLLDQTLLHDYIFEWGATKNECIMALGYVPLYNHSYTSNCEYEMDFETKEISIKTVKDISAGEELTINYNGDWDDSTPVWFDVL